MKSSRIRLLKSQADDLADVCALGADALTRVSEAIKSAKRTISQDKLKGVIASVISSESAEKLSRVIVGLSTVKSRTAASRADVVDGLTDDLETRYGDDDRFKNWSQVKAALLEILECESVYLAAKAIDLSYDFERILTSCRILTSIRPIYTDKRDVIVGSTIVQNLRIEFVSDGGERGGMSFSVDMADLENIRKVCIDAITKADTAKRQLSDTWHSEIVIPGVSDELEIEA